MVLKPEHEVLPLRPTLRGASEGVYNVKRQFDASLRELSTNSLLIDPKLVSTFVRVSEVDRVDRASIANYSR